MTICATKLPLHSFRHTVLFESDTLNGGSGSPAAVKIAHSGKSSHAYRSSCAWMYGLPCGSIGDGTVM